jgi:hypothetical protein
MSSSTNLWTAIVFMIPVLLLEASYISGFTVYNCSPDQLKTQTINPTAPKDCKDPETDYYPVRTTELTMIMTDGDWPIMATQCLDLKSQEVFCCGGHPSFHYGLAKIVIDQPVEVTPQECRDALTTGKITVQGQSVDFKVGASKFHQYYTEAGRDSDGTCLIRTFTRKDVTYEKSYEETTIKILISKVRGIKLGNTIKFPSGLIAPHSDGVVRDALNGMLIWSTKELPCGDMISLMYQGRAKLHQAKSNVKASLEEAIILVEQIETRRYAGLVLEGMRSLCGHICHNTQIPNVVACLETEDPNRDWRFLKPSTTRRLISSRTCTSLTSAEAWGTSGGLRSSRRWFARSRGRGCSTNSRPWL